MGLIVIHDNNTRYPHLHDRHCKGKESQGECYETVIIEVVIRDGGEQEKGA